MLISILFLIVAGVALPCCGARLQTMWDNPLGDIYSIGLGSAACLGASLAALSGTTMFWGSFSCCILASILAFNVFKRVGLQKFLTFGMLFGSLIGAFGTIVANNCTPEALQSYYRWAGASFDINVETFDLFVAIATILSNALILTLGRKFLDERLEFFCISMLVSAIISVCGIIGMISLTIPNLSRIITKDPKIRKILTMTLGVGLLLVTYGVSKISLGVYLPISATMSIISFPLLIFTMRGQ